MHIPTASVGIHKMTMTSFAITRYSQCCRRYVVRQQVRQVVSDVKWSLTFSVVRIVEVSVACVLNEILICYYACSSLYLERLFCFTQQTRFAVQHGGVYLVIIDRELSDVTAS